MLDISKRWYHVFNLALLVFCLSITGGYILNISVSTFTHFNYEFSLSSSIAILSIICAIYILLNFLFNSKKQYYWITTLCGGMLFALIQLHFLLDSTPNFKLLYEIGWFLMVGYCGAFGIVMLLAVDFLTLVYVIITSNFNFSSISMNDWILLFGSLIVSLAGYFAIWKQIYIASRKEQNRKLNQLAAMLKNNATQSEVLIESLADGVIVVNNEGKITLMNKAAANMTGWDVEDTIGLDLKLVLSLSQDNGHEYPEGQNPFVVSLTKKVKTVSDGILTNKNGVKIYVSCVISPVTLPSETEGTIVGVIGVLRDVTVQRQSEQQRSDFVSTASHEMRTPVAAIEGYLSLAMNDKVSNIDSKAREYLTKAYDSTRHLSKLFQDLLTSSKAEDGRLTNHPVVMEMSAFIKDLFDNFQLLAQKKNLLVDLTVSSDPNQTQPTGKVILPLFYVHADPDRMREVITNLFDNACKYTEAGKITLGLSGNTQIVQFFIKDSGQGIPADDIPHLFQKFYRADNSATRTIGGAGLGLYICKKIVEMYGGKIWVESTVGQGSTFHIDLPRLSSEQADQQRLADAAQNTITPASTSI